MKVLCALQVVFLLFQQAILSSITSAVCKASLLAIRRGDMSKIMTDNGTHGWDRSLCVLRFTAFFNAEDISLPYIHTNDGGCSAIVVHKFGPVNSLTAVVVGAALCAACYCPCYWQHAQKTKDCLQRELIASRIYTERGPISLPP